MPRRRPRDLAELVQVVAKKIRPPVCIVLGSPREVVHLIGGIDCPQIDCYQMDLFQAERLQEEVGRAVGSEVELVVTPNRNKPDKSAAKTISLPLVSENTAPNAAAKRIRILAAADLWDVPDKYQTLLYPVPERGERSLKIDMIEQAFHVLRPQGALVVLSPYEKDDLFRAALKKVFGRGVHEPAVEHASVFWCTRSGERPRRRHEIVFQVRTPMGPSLRFVSRPGVFCYGRLDDGARALVECMEIEAGERVLDLGCGIGSNGIQASLLTGPQGEIVFLDSSLRAVALAELNAANCGLASFRTVASSGIGSLASDSFDVVLANPPYYAQGAIAERFIIDALQLLRPGGRLWLVTKNFAAVGTMVAETFGDAEAVECRGYVVLCARK